MDNTTLPIIFVAASGICWAVGKGYLILPGVNLPPSAWATVYWSRGKYWRLKNVAKTNWRLMRKEFKLRQEQFTRWRKGNPKTTDLGKLFTNVITTQLNRELAEGMINKGNQQDWLLRFSVVKGLENLRPYHANPKLSKMGKDALKLKIKGRLETAYATPAKLPAEPWVGQPSNTNVVTIRRVTGNGRGVRVLKLVNNAKSA